MNDSVKQENAACWSSYWAGGALTSLPEDFRANYDGEIEAFWRARGDLLPDGARVLDVCTGNGAVALLLARIARQAGRRLQITAIDAARIHPEVVRQHYPRWADLVGDIRFVGNRRFETVAMEPASVDLIASQYGIEYCDWPAAAAKSFELLRPGGHLAFLSHSLSSDMLERMQQEQAEYQQLHELGLVELFRKLLDGAIDEATGRERLDELRRAMEAIPNWKASALFGYAHGLVTRTLGMSRRQLRQYAAPIRAACQQLDDGFARLSQMLRVNQALRDHPDWTDVFVKAGLERVDSDSLLYQQTHRVGDYFIFKR